MSGPSFYLEPTMAFCRKTWKAYTKTAAYRDWCAEYGRKLFAYIQESHEMPQYEHECPNCGHQETTICTVAERPIEPECPKCKAKMDWTPQRNARQFKGRGWTPKFGAQ